MHRIPFLYFSNAKRTYCSIVYLEGAILKIAPEEVATLRLVLFK